MVLLHLLPDVLVGFRKAYPEIVLDLVVSNTMLDLSRRDADVALRATYPAAGHAERTPPRQASPGRSMVRADDVTPFDPLTDGRRHDWIGFADHSSIAKAT